MTRWFVISGIFTSGDFTTMEPGTGDCVGPFESHTEALSVEDGIRRRNIDICWHTTWVVSV